MLFSLIASFLLIPKVKQDGAAYIILCTELLVLSFFIFDMSSDLNLVLMQAKEEMFPSKYYVDYKE